MTNVVEIEVRERDKTKGFEGANRSAFRLTGSLGKIGGVAGRASVGLGGVAKAGGLVGVALGAAGTAVVGTGLKVTDYAGKLDLLKKKSATVFGSELGRVQQWAKVNAHAMGLTKGEAVGLGAGLADLLIPMGFTRKAAADMATKTVGLSGALAEWSGGTKTASEVTEILSAAFMGERDGLNALGISITQAEVDARLLAKGQDKLTGSQKQQAEATATQQLIMEKSKDAQKAFADGAGSLARKTAESKARLREMGETLATKATPALLKIGEGVQKHVLPALERFGGWLENNRFKIGLVFVDLALAVTSLVKTFGPAMKFIVTMSMAAFGTVLQGAAKLDNALGGHLGIQKHADNFKSFSEGVAHSFDVVIQKANDWNVSLEKTKKELTLKANIQDLESKLKTAKTQLGDKSLTKERRAQIVATIKDLQNKLQTAHTQLDASWVTRARTAKLQADKRDLDAKIRAAKNALDSPKLTATKKAKLTADIKELQARRKAAQEEIDRLHGKSVTIDMRFTSAGVNLSAHVKKESRWMGGAVKGPGTGTSDTAGLFALSNDEHIVTAREVHGAGGHAAIEAQRRRWAKGLATGGRTGGATISSRFDLAAQRGAERAGQVVGPYGRALGWARSQDSASYLMGAVGPGRYDCSGFMSGIANVIQGRSPHSRRGSTGTFPWSGFSRGSGLFSIGSVRGNPGHMAGTLLGVNVESRGGDGVVVGSRARGAGNGLFGGNVYHLGRLAGGGRAGDAPFDLISPAGLPYGRNRTRRFASGGRVSRLGSMPVHRLGSMPVKPRFSPPSRFSLPAQQQQKLRLQLAEYRAAKARQAGWSREDQMHPSADMLSDVSTIRSWERRAPSLPHLPGTNRNSATSGFTFQLPPAGNALERMFLDWLRQAIRNSGGNVQTALGS